MPRREDEIQGDARSVGDGAVVALQLLLSTAVIDALVALEPGKSASRAATEAVHMVIEDADLNRRLLDRITAAWPAVDASLRPLIDYVRVADGLLVGRVLVPNASLAQLINVDSTEVGLRFSAYDNESHVFYEVELIHPSKAYVRIVRRLRTTMP